jgi:hypothetical protein
MRQLVMFAFCRKTNYFYGGFMSGVIVSTHTQEQSDNYEDNNNPNNQQHQEELGNYTNQLIPNSEEYWLFKGE